jgi:hypothetical protein
LEVAGTNKTSKRAACMRWATTCKEGPGRAGEVKTRRKVHALGDVVHGILRLSKWSEGTWRDACRTER